jgi:hypothetical protein
VIIFGSSFRANRRRVDVEAVMAGAAADVMGHVAADGRRRDDDAVARFGRGHEGVKIGDGTGRNPDFRVARPENLCREFGGDHLDSFDAFETHLVFVARVPERGPGPEPGSESCLGARIHDVRRWIEIDAVVLVGRAVERDCAIECGQNRV